MTDTIKLRLEYLRQELRAERISTSELAELQSLAEYIEPGDVELLEAVGIPEFPEEVDGAMTDKEKIQAILSILTDKNVGALVAAGEIENGEEAFGALVFAGYAFKKALAIAENKSND